MKIGTALRAPNNQGALLGISGSLSMAMNIGLEWWGWVFFLISNVLLIRYFHQQREYGLLTMQVVFLGVSLLGVVRWW